MSSRQENVSAVITGQPNSGKSSVFRLLTRIHQDVSNYPGTTVDTKSGHYHEGDLRITVVDMPGTYTLSSETPESRITKNFIFSERPEVVIAVVDATHLRRSLLLLLELAEMQVPLVICLNFWDVAKRRGAVCDCKLLENYFQAPVIPLVATRGTGLDDLRKAIVSVCRKHEHFRPDWRIRYDESLEKILSKIEDKLRESEHLVEDFPPRYLAVKLAEGDRQARRLVEHHTHDDSWQKLLTFADEEFFFFIDIYDQTPRKLIVAGRRALVEKIASESFRQDRPNRSLRSDLIDRYVCHPIFGPAILLCLMVLVFEITFQVADQLAWLPVWGGQGLSWMTPVELLDTFFHLWLPDWLESHLHLTSPVLSSFLRHGVLAGMGGVIQFVPVIFVMFTMLALLEQSGYVARVAMIMDRFMRRFGLAGRSILPIVLGGGIAGGCAVPAIMAARSIGNRRSRLLTVLIIPMLNCGGKLPIYGMLVAAFFSAYQGLVMTAVLFFSWACALATAWLLARTILKGPELPLLLELPTYQLPPVKEVLGSSLRQSGEFLKKAGTVILAANIFLWFLMSFPQAGPHPTVPGSPSEVAMEVATSDLQRPAGPTDDSATTVPASSLSSLDHSYAAAIGRFLEPVTGLAGFNWKDNVSFIGGTAAKELIVSSMSTLYNAERSEAERDDDSQSQKERRGRLLNTLANSDEWSPLKALAMLVFVMLYAPCSGTVVTMYRVTGSWHWPAFSYLFNTALALALAIAIYQIGSLFHG
ncbi:MAG: ferrous iron transport protein B [Planctomycetia bacterium]|nr:ferrous iron transport protein B [Planctomycetia bacterium]